MPGWLIGRLRLGWIGSGIGPGVAAGFAEPVVGGFNGFEGGVFGTAFGTGGDFVSCGGLEFFHLVEDVLRDGLRCDGAGLIELSAATRI